MLTYLYSITRTLLDWHPQYWTCVQNQSMLFNYTISCWQAVYSPDGLNLITVTADEEAPRCYLHLETGEQGIDALLIDGQWRIHLVTLSRWESDRWKTWEWNPSTVRYLGALTLPVQGS